MQRSTKKILSILVALCMLISIFPAQVIAFAQGALENISVSDEAENVSNAASDTFYGEWRYKISVIRNKTEYFYDADSFFSTMASANKGTFLLYCNHELTDNVIVPADVTFMLPMNSTDTVGKGNGTADTSIPREAWTQEETYLYATLTIPQGKRLTVDGTMLVGGIVGCPDQSSQGHTAGAYSQVVNNGSLVVNGTLDIYGLVKGTGTTSVNDGGIMKIPFLLNDFDGGTNSVTLRDAGVFPFNQFAMNNIQTACVFNYGCQVVGKGLIYFHSLSMYLDADATLLGPDEGALIMLPGSKVFSEYDETKYIDAAIGGQNGTTVLNEFGKTTLTTTGDVCAGNICLSYQVYNFDSADFVLGVPYCFDLIIENGTFTVPYKYRFMPGCKCTVSENATLNLSGELQVTDGWEQLVMSEKRYPTSAQLKDNGFSQVGNLVVNGTFNILSGATFAGIIQTTDPENAVVNIADGATLSGTFNSGANNRAVIYDLSARANFGEGLDDLEAGKSYTAATADEWILPSYTMTVKGVETTVEINETMYGTFNAGEELPEIIAVENSGSVVDDTENVIYGIPAGIESVETYVETTSSDSEAVLVKSGSKVATGDVVQLVKDGAVIDTYTVVIIGDTDCDGLCTGMDSVFVECVSNGLINSSNAEESVLKAADCNHDGLVDENDVLYAQSTGLFVGSYFNAS
ncbi:MAG: hypothetical protein IJU45_07685, partial [Clostridia bacterium]|nr:hypothetical protein [Clostridia bacterium]